MISNEIVASYVLISHICTVNVVNMNGREKEKEKKIEKPILSYRSQLPSDRKVHFMFCEFLKGFGASYYTMRDRIIYRTSPIDEWELRGVERMMREYAPGYHGLLCDYFDTLSRDERGQFVAYMMEKGGMSKTNCYARFRTFNFAPWEMRGLLALERVFLATSYELQDNSYELQATSDKL